jgi:hypothetical protein
MVLIVLSQAATLISSNVDERDHAFILGSTNPKLKSLVSVMRAAEKQGLSGPALQEIEDKWTAQAALALYPDTLAEALKQQGVSQDKIKAFLAKVSGTAHASHDETSRIAQEEFGLKQLPYWNWDTPRTREGFYRYQGGTQCAINRAVEFAPYADLLWMETKSVSGLYSSRLCRGSFFILRCVSPSTRKPKNSLKVFTPSDLVTGYRTVGQTWIFGVNTADCASIRLVAFVQLEGSRTERPGHEGICLEVGQAWFRLAVHHPGRPAYQRVDLQPFRQGIRRRRHEGLH